MSFVTVFMTVTTAFVLLAPLAMAAILVTGGVPSRRKVAAATAPATAAACGCPDATCHCVAELTAA